MPRDRGQQAARSREAQHPGAQADKPTEIPKEGWLEIVKRAWKETKDDHMPLLAAGVAYYAFLALFPALIAALTVYGLFASPQQVEQQVSSWASALPSAAREVITSQLSSVAAGSSGALSVALVISVAGALWGASGGVMGLVKATNVAYDEDETRGFLKLRGLALLLTLGAIVFIAIAVGLIAVVPVVLNAIGLGGVATVLLQIGRWVLLLVAVTAALAIVYRVAPDRDAPKMRWVSLGAAVATALWVIGSLAFSFYVSNFGSYQETYGAFAGVAILLLWLYLTAFIVLFGAEINSEAEHQTMRDSTKGEEQPMGERRARMADTTAG